MTAPPGRSLHGEMTRLEPESHHPAAQLRLAWLLGEAHRHDESMTRLNSLLYGGIDHGPAVESFARYLRAEAFDRDGDSERADHERREALTRAIDPELRSRLQAKLKPAKPATPVAGPVRVLPRSKWNARAAKKMTPMGRVTRITVHHSAMLARDRSVSAAVATLRAIQRNHQDRNGWSDLGYHYIIDAGGRVWQGRDARWQGAHAGDPQKNRGNVGVCLLGNFVDGGQRPSREQVQALSGLLNRIMAEHGLQRTAILTHRELKVTGCPGELLQRVVDQLRGFPMASR